MSENEKKEIAKKICDLIDNFNLNQKEKLVEPPNLLKLEQVSERSGELTFTSKVSKSSDFDPGKNSDRISV